MWHLPCRQSLSSLSGPLQVVPDIDDQMSNSDSSQEVSVEWGTGQDRGRASFPSLAMKRYISPALRPVHLQVPSLRRDNWRG